MGKTVTHYVSGKLSSDSALSRQQRENVDAIIRISDDFHMDAGIHECQKISVSEKLLVLESGHQPNFLPYPGVWKKVLLLHQIKECLIDNGHDAIAVFGFADQNLSTAKLLYENKIPALNKQGNRKFGFKIPDAQKWKCFNTIDKPTEDDWEREIDDLKNYYLRYLSKINSDSRSLLNNIDSLNEILEKCYKRSQNMADLNAFVFARMCWELFDVPVYFFRYSDVQQHNLFVDEWKKILGSLPVYNKIFNTSIHEKNLNLSPVSPNFFPFWCHCACGNKVVLSADSEPGFKGTCPVCKTKFSFVLDSDRDNLAILMKNMGLSAVARNVIFSEGLGTCLFISGSGGGLRYGQVANEISRRLSMNIPITLSWQSRDYYIGIIHRVALNDMFRLFNLTCKDLISGLFNEKITRFRTTLLDQIENVQQGPQKKKELDKYSGLYRSTATQLTITQKTFSTIPSIIDLLINFDASYIRNQWDIALNSAKIEDSGEIILLKQDVSYRQDNVPDLALTDIPRIYHSLELINEL